MNAELRQILNYERSTKRTHVFKTSDSTAAFDTLYVQKVAMPEAPPTQVEVLVRPLSNGGQA